MARMLPRLLLPVLMAAAACGRAADDAASGGRTDTGQPAVAPSAGRDTAQARQDVLRLEAELFQSYMRGDGAPSARILAESYMGFSGDGLRETKAQMLANLRRDSTTATAAAVDSIHVDSTTVGVYGDAVVAQASGTLQVRDGGKSVTVGFRNTDVFVWRDGRWQIVASHVSKVVPAARAAR